MLKNQAIHMRQRRFRRQQRGSHAAAAVVTADDHVAYLQHPHRVFEDARGVVVVGMKEVGDVAMNE